MEYKNRIRSLHLTDESTAQTIMEQYPPQWDMDKVFRKTYQKYLALQQEEAALERGCVQAAEVPKDAAAHQKFKRTGGYVFLTAAYIGMLLFVFKIADMAPPAEHFPDETNDSDVFRPETHPDAETTSAAEHTTAATQSTTEVQTQITETTTFSETITNTAEHSTEQTSPADPQATDSLTETAPPVSEIIQPAASSEQTAAPDTKQTDETTTTAATPETTTETTTTAAVLGHFEVDETAPAGQFRNVRYFRAEDTPVEERVHGFAAEGFTVTRTEEVNGSHDFRSMSYFIEDTDGQHYMVQQFRYDYFGVSVSPTRLWRTYEIAGKPVIIIYEENAESVCTMLWDDGCHVCLMNSQYKDLAKMELLMQGHITN